MWQKLCIFVTWKIHSRYAHTDAWSWHSSTAQTYSPRRHGRNWRSGSTTTHTWTRNWPCWAKPPALAPIHRRRSGRSWRRWGNRSQLTVDNWQLTIISSRREFILSHTEITEIISKFQRNNLSLASPKILSLTTFSSVTTRPNMQAWWLSLLHRFGKTKKNKIFFGFSLT